MLKHQNKIMSMNTANRYLIKSSCREQSHTDIFGYLIVIWDGDVMGARSFFQPVLFNQFSFGDLVF